MNLSSLSEKVFDTLQEFDSTTQPFGLYSARDILLQPNANEITLPFTTRMEAREDLQDLQKFWRGLVHVDERASLNTPRFSLLLPDFGFTSLQMARTSKIKVRQYGSKYHVDKHENFDERWGQLGMDKAIAALWSSGNAGVPLRLLLFVGFDKAQRPFERELRELKPHQTRASHGIEFFERTWDDSVGRGFKIRAGLWAHQLRKRTNLLP